jgi:Protein of unknown function (DUF3617)
MLGTYLVYSRVFRTSPWEIIMRFRLATVAAFACATLTALPSLAQNIKPGLWEMNSKMQSGSGKLEMAMAAMQAQLANMTPEQRKTMENLMAQRGVKLSGGPDAGVLVKMCLTPEMVAQNQLPLQQNGDCSTTRSPVKGNIMKVAFTCARPASSGEGQVTFVSDSAYRLNMKITSNAGGSPETMDVDGSGKWLGADCGNIKPAANGG